MLLLVVAVVGCRVGLPVIPGLVVFCGVGA